MILDTNALSAWLDGDPKIEIELSAATRVVLSAIVFGTPIPWHDVWIAAQARQHYMPVLSRDAHFDYVQGITRIGW